MFLIVIFIANLKVVAHTSTRYSLGIIIQVLSFLCYLILELIANFIIDYDLYNILFRLFLSPNDYYLFILILTSTVLFDYGFVIYNDFNYFMKLTQSL